MDINFELYKVFYYVARFLSFSEASTQLYISQSAVSQAIKTLEEKINCKLFLRNTKKVKLTQEGEILYSHIEQAYNYIKAGEKSINDIHSLERGEVRIGASDTICKYHLLTYFKEFNRLYPKVTIHVTNRPSPRCIELLEKGNVDVAVVNLSDTLKFRKDLNIKTISVIQDVFVAGKVFKALTNRLVDLNMLGSYPIMMLERNSTTRRFTEEYLNKKGVKLTPEIELGSMDLLIDLAKIGLGISMVVREYIDPEDLKSGELFILKVTDTFPSRSIGVVTKNSLPTPLAAKKFIELLLPS